MRKEKLDCIPLLLALRLFTCQTGRPLKVEPGFQSSLCSILGTVLCIIMYLLGEREQFSYLDHGWLIRITLISAKIAITIFSFQLVDSATYRQMHWSNSPSKLQLCVPFSRICWSVSFILYVGLLGGLAVKNLPANVGDVGSILGSGRSMETEMATHSSITVWEIPSTEERGRNLEGPWGSWGHRVGQDLATK